jgi:hypothetical protein
MAIGNIKNTFARRALLVASVVIVVPIIAIILLSRCLTRFFFGDTEGMLDEVRETLVDVKHRYVSSWY